VVNRVPNVGERVRILWNDREGVVKGVDGMYISVKVDDGAWIEEVYPPEIEEVVEGGS
jgi:hypothetical protein